MVSQDIIRIATDGSVTWSSSYSLRDRSSSGLRWVSLKNGRDFTWYRDANGETLLSVPTVRESDAGWSWKDAQRWRDRSNEDLQIDSRMVMLNSDWETTERESSINVSSGTTRRREASRTWAPEDAYSGLGPAHPANVSSSRAKCQGQLADPSHTDDWSTFPKDKLAGTGFAVPHFCIFQGDKYGLDGWDTRDRCRRNGWDSILATLLFGVKMDGQWHSEVCASAFVSADALHITGDIQPLAMPWVHTRADYGVQRERPPASMQTWVTMLWDRRGVDHLGLRWDLDNQVHDRWHALQEKRALLLGKVDALLEGAPPGSIALLMNCKKPEVTYEHLKRLGGGREPHAERVFILLSGAQGFDGQGDEDTALLDSILERFVAHFGRDRVLRVALGERPGDGGAGTSAEVAAFIRTEFAYGALARAVAGAEVASAKHASAVARREPAGRRHDFGTPTAKRAPAAPVPELVGTPTPGIGPQQASSAPRPSVLGSPPSRPPPAPPTHEAEFAAANIANGTTASSIPLPQAGALAGGDPDDRRQIEAKVAAETAITAELVEEKERQEDDEEDKVDEENAEDESDVEHVREDRPQIQNLKEMGEGRLRTALNTQVERGLSQNKRQTQLNVQGQCAKVQTRSKSKPAIKEKQVVSAAPYEAGRDWMTTTEIRILEKLRQAFKTTLVVLAPASLVVYTAYRWRLTLGETGWCVIGAAPLVYYVAKSFPNARGHAKRKS